MKLELGQLGAGGLIEDIKPFDLPPNIFNDTLNVEFTGFAIRPMVKEIPALQALPETREPIELIQGWVYGNVIIYLAVCEDSIWLWYMNDWHNVTPSDFVSSLSWQVFLFNGFVIVNSGDNVPYYLNPFDFLKPMKVIPSWPEALKTRYLFGYSGFLVGLGLTSSDGYFDRQVIFWSDLAELGQLPSNFSFTDPTSRSGFTSLEDAEDFVIGLALRNTYILYRAYSIYEMRFVGGNAVFAFERRLQNTRLLSAKTVCEFDGVHFFIADSGFYIYDGFEKRPIGKGQVSDTFYKNLNRDKISEVVVQHDSGSQLIWIYYPEPELDKANKAYVFNYRQNTFAKREINGANAYGFGILPSTGDLIAWAHIGETWAEWEANWTITYTDSRVSNILWVVNNIVYQLPASGVSMEGYARRFAMAFAEQDQAGTLTVNRTARKIVTEVWPELASGQIGVNFATSEYHPTEYDWEVVEHFDSAIELKMDRAFSGKYIAIEFNNSPEGEGDPLYYELTGFALEVSFGGKY